MPIRVPSHLCRNRHGTFYFRLTIPPRLRQTVGRSEVRLSLGTETRREAIIHALSMTAGLPLMLAELQRMTDDQEQAQPDYFQKWRDELFKSSALRAKVAILQGDINALTDRLADMVPRDKAKQVAKLMHEKGQLAGRHEIEANLVFPWPPEKTRLFSELGKAYLASFDYRLAKGTRKPPSAKAREKYGRDIELFAVLMGDVNIGAIDREVAGEYVKLLKRLPANMNKIAKYRGKTIEQILAMRPEPQSELTISGKVGTLSSMFKWALLEKRKWGIDVNPFEGFALADKTEKTRRPFTDAELIQLLGHKTFTSRKFRTSYGYWLIPLGLFTGARLGELCQLDLKDFVTIDGIDCIDINDIEAKPEAQDEGRRAKTLKTKNAKRLVPLHPELIKIGLLRYVAALRRRGEVHLFPELSRERRDGPAHAASNWFQKFRANVGLTEKQVVVYHSFRNLFITRLLDAGVSPHMVAPIVGHEAELITGQVYWNTKDATKRKPTVDAFTLPLEVSALIPKLEDVRLPR